jgi:hypothetical protein
MRVSFGNECVKPTRISVLCRGGTVFSKAANGLDDSTTFVDLLLHVLYTRVFVLDRERRPKCYREVFSSLSSIPLLHSPLCCFAKERQPGGFCGRLGLYAPCNAM